MLCLSLHRSAAATHLPVAFSLALAIIAFIIIIINTRCLGVRRRDRPPTVCGLKDATLPYRCIATGTRRCRIVAPLRDCDVVVRCAGSFLGSMNRSCGCSCLTAVLTRRAAASHSRWTEVAGINSDDNIISL